MPLKYQAPIVKKAFQILKLLSDNERGLGISELSRTLEIGKSTVHGITSALEEVGAVMRTPLTKKYTLGFTFFELGRLAYTQTALIDLAKPIMEELMERTHESVFLGVLNRERVTILNIVESRNDLKITSPIGTTIPLLAAATAKVFLASMEEEQAIEIISRKGLIKYTENSITDLDRYLQEIRRVREEGHSVDYEEYIPGVRAVASLIRGEKRLVSAIWVVGFKSSLDENKMKLVIRETKDAAEAISRKVQKQLISLTA
jgi:IclR family KDG regulon transcriptional repressor